MTTNTIRLASGYHRKRAIEMVRSCPEGWYIVAKEPMRTLDQNAKLHAMLADVQSQVESMRTFSIDDMKKRFMHAMGAEMRFLPELEGGGMFPVGLSTKDLTKRQFALLVELVYKYGNERGVLWSEPVEEMG